ncbi:MAG: choice-of-anchor D domain-containing protein [Candidatus Kapabacteria bacterium]|nr:choice-of-anchor D domain-containing protein [Candidatus Kapabacteria bacterium]
MRRILFFIYILSLGSAARSQSLSVFKLDSSAFPIINAKFYATDANGNQIRSLSASDFSVIENGQPRTIIDISCPAPKPPVALSSVLVMDQSGSMSLSNKIDAIHQAATSWIKALPGRSECAITSFDNNNYIIQDFTTNKTLLEQKAITITANGGTDYNKALKDPMAGGILMAQTGKYRRVIVMMSDGEPNFTPNTQQIINDAIANAIIIYFVSLGYPSPQCMKDITSKTGGQYFENVSTVEEAKKVYMKIMQAAIGGEPCDISWQSDYSCKEEIINVQISLIPLNQTAKIKYTYPSNSTAKLDYSPSYVLMKNVNLGTKRDTIIKLTAINADFNIINITSSNTAFTINNTSFYLAKGKSIDLIVSFISTDSGYTFSKFSIETNLCPYTFFVSGGFIGKAPNVKTLKLTKPNGGEEFVVGSDTMITWEGIAESENINLEFSIDSGLTWNSIVNKTSSLKYKWHNIPKPTSQKCLVRVKQISGVGASSQAGSLEYNLKGHSDFVNVISWSPDGSRVATASSDKNSIIWNAEYGTIMFILKGHTQQITHISWSPDGSRVATASRDSTSIIWDASTGAKLFTLKGHTRFVNYVSWSPDGSRVATAGYDYTSIIWNAATGAKLFTLSGHTDLVNSINWSLDGNRVATASFDFKSIIWDANKGTKLFTLTGHTLAVANVFWSPDSSRLATAGYDNKCIIWDGKKGTKLFTLIGHANYLMYPSWSPDGSRLATPAGDNTAIIWDANKGTQLFTLIGHALDVLQVSWSPDGSRLATASKDKTSIIWDAINGTKLFTLTGHSNFVNFVSWSPDGSHVATASNDSSAKIWFTEDKLGVLQEDQSDSLFSIVAPQANSVDIDMKQCLVANTKDSVVTTFLTNTGTYTIRIDTVYFKGNDATQFKILNNYYPLYIAPGVTQATEFLFIPTSTGIKTSQIKIITQSDTLTQNIQGEGIQMKLALGSSIIDFDTVRVHSLRDSVCSAVIKNTGTIPVKFTGIEFQGPNLKDFKLSSGAADTSFTLSGGESATISLRFAPSDMGRTTCMLALKYNDLGSPSIVQLYGFGYAKTINVSQAFATDPTVNCSDAIKDSIVIKNLGNTPIQIKCADISGPDSSSFVFCPAFSPFTINKKDTVSLPIIFKPIKSGWHIAYIDINTNADPDSIYSFEFHVYNNEVSYQINTNLINIDSLGQSHTKDTSITLTNKGESKMAWRVSANNNIEVTPATIILSQGKSGRLNIHYKGSDIFGQINEKITLTDTLCNRSNNILINGKVGGYIGAVLAVGSAEAAPGEIIEIPIKLIKAENISQSKATGISTQLNFNSSLLLPLNFPNGTVSNSIRTIELNDLPLDKEEIARIKFKVALGDTEETRLWLTKFHSVGDTTTLDTINGIFKLKGLCHEGGTRLISTTDKPGFSIISPNPAENKLNLEFLLNEPGYTEICIFNILGEKVQTIFTQIVTQYHKRKIEYDVSNLAMGQYLIILRSPTYSDSQQILILK